VSISKIRIFSLLKRNYSDYFFLLIILCVGQIITTQLFSLSFGPIQGGDSFLSLAEKFPDLSATEWSYGGYVSILYLGSLLGSSEWFTFFLQMAVVFAASKALLTMGRQLDGEMVGWLAASIYLCHPMVAQWSRYLLTDSLFYAFIVLSASELIRIMKKDSLSYKKIFLYLLVVATLRPNGIVFVATVALIALTYTASTKIKKSFSVGLVVTLFLLVALFSPTLNSGNELNNFGPQAWNGVVVHGVEEERIDMPQPDNFDASNKAFLVYIAKNPLSMLELGTKRVWWELKQVRPWYSKNLNNFLKLSMTIFYVTSAIGFWVSRKETTTKVVTGITIPFVILIGATWAIWEGRFAWWFLSLWTLWSAKGSKILFSGLPRFNLHNKNEKKAICK